MPIVFLAAAFGAMRNLQNFGVGLILGRCRMNLQIAKFTGEGDMLSLRQFLIAKEDHAIFEQS